MIQYYGLNRLYDNIFNNDRINKINPNIFQFRCRFIKEHNNITQIMEKSIKNLFRYIKII